MASCPCASGWLQGHHYDGDEVGDDSGLPPIGNLSLGKANMAVNSIRRGALPTLAGKGAAGNAAAKRQSVAPVAAGTVLAVLSRTSRCHQRVPAYLCNGGSVVSVRKVPDVCLCSRIPPASSQAPASTATKWVAPVGQCKAKQVPSTTPERATRQLQVLE